MKAKKYEDAVCCEEYLEQNKSMWIQSQVFRNKITCANWKDDKSTRELIRFKFICFRRSIYFSADIKMAS